MELPKLTYDDFYKFCVSAGIILFLTGWLVTSYFVVLIQNANFKDIIWKDIIWVWVITIPSLIIAVVGFILIFWGGQKWYENQKLLDEKLKNEVALSKHATAETIQKISSKESLIGETKPHKIELPKIDYKIASVLPGTVKFDFQKDWKVWFLVRNLDSRNYKVYFKIQFYINDKLVDAIKDGYYDGTKAWNLNSNTFIHAPGLNMPETVRDKYLAEKGKFEIRIDCEIKDENDNLLDKKLPIGYVYDPENQSWYFEP